MADRNRDLLFQYSFKFQNDSEKIFDIALDANTLEVRSPGNQPRPEWTKLEYERCDDCPLAGKSEYCPIALNFAHLVLEFAARLSYENAIVTVHAPERTYTRETAVQRGLSSIMGIYMVTSNCPIMDELRPVVRHHLPFASPTETLIRIVGWYLINQYFRMKEGKDPDWELANLIQTYKQISKVNQGIARRLAHASKEDANLNAIVILHSLGDTVPFYIEQGLDDIKHLFNKYLRGELLLPGDGQ